MKRREFALGLLALVFPLARKPPPGKNKRRTYGQGSYGFGTYGGD